MATEGKVIRCKAAVAWAAKQPLVIEDVDVAPPKQGEVRIKIVATGVCHSDATGLKGVGQGILKGIFPAILGHEGSGIVESVGPGVTNVKPGDHVIPLYMAECGECDNCKSPKTNLCTKIIAMQMKGFMSDGTSRFTCKGKVLHHYMGTSTFSQYTVVADVAVVKIPDSLPLEKVCLLGCGVSTGYGAAINTAKVEEGSTCAIWGLGGIATGVCRTDATSLKGIGEDLIEGIFPTILGHEGSGIVESVGPGVTHVKPGDHVIPLYMAECGECDNCKSPKTNLCTKIIAMQMKGFMPDGTSRFTCKGKVLHHYMGTSTFSQYTVVADVAVVKVNKICQQGWGQCIVLGVPPAGSNMSLPPFSFLYGKTMKGSVYGGWKSRSSMPRLVKDYQEKRIILDEFVTFTRPLARINDGFELMNDGKAIRTVIDMF
ncbi:alcohol dehydrogenase class-3 [Hyalella azteca]|uniref:Alcohol dehydrogenase class-3 n=1 Tax=Hyalella azteca TaxID=294128 RepID=A0A979FRX0_HYAAZ|nr:alcohol dehydrogenase class-3 [Hyalella azteca]